MTIMEGGVREVKNAEYTGSENMVTKGSVFFFSFAGGKSAEWWESVYDISL